MRVKMTPYSGQFASDDESGIKQVSIAYEKYGPKFGIDFVSADATTYDLAAVHAGMMSNFDNRYPLVAHLHGLYWSADYDAEKWELAANKNVIDSILRADEVTVPSDWVAESLRRDVRIDPHIIYHGIDWWDWEHEEENLGYVLWNKNRFVDVCSPEAVRRLARARPDVDFYTTFAPDNSPNNVYTTGVIPHRFMKRAIQQAGIYLSTTKETFGIGTLEALASGVPVLGFAHGGNLITIQHEVNGYLAKPEDYNDLMNGLEYCMKYRKVLGDNARETVKQFTWDKAMVKVVDVYEKAIRRFSDRQRPHQISLQLLLQREQGELRDEPISPDSRI